MTCRKNEINIKNKLFFQIRDQMESMQKQNVKLVKLDFDFEEVENKGAKLAVVRRN